MRGSDKLKEILAHNNEIKSLLLKLVFIYNIIVLFVYYNWKSSFSLFILSSFIEAAAYFALFKLCSPVIVEEKGIKKLIKVVSMNSPGAVSFCWDILFCTLLGKFLIAFNWKWLIIYLGVPLSFFLEFFYNPYKKIRYMK